MPQPTLADPEAEAVEAFWREVPECPSGAVLIRAIARSRGVRTKVAVDSEDPAVDSMAACVGPHAHRLQSISAALGGEAVHITTWSPHAKMMIRNALAPLRVSGVELDEQSHRALVTVPRKQPARVLETLEGQRELAIRLSGWDIELVLEPDGA